MPANLYMALVHYPVYNKNREVTGTAVFNYDIHDMSRAARTYGVATFFIIQPIQKQLELGRKIIYHWTEDWGSTYNPRRKDALHTVVLRRTLADAMLDIEAQTGRPPKTVVTDAKPFDRSISYAAFREALNADASQPYLLLFGTGWGLTAETVDACDYILAPVYGEGSYNHLSVRSAASIILDRLCGH